MTTRRIQLKRGTSAQWASSNRILTAGEIGVDLTEGLFKLGDGMTPWNDLDFYAGSVSDLTIADIDGLSGALAANAPNVTHLIGTRPAANSVPAGTLHIEGALFTGWTISRSTGSTWTEFGPMASQLLLDVLGSSKRTLVVGAGSAHQVYTTGATDGSQSSVQLGPSTVLARLASGGIVAATPAELRTLLDVLTTAQVSAAAQSEIASWVGAAPEALDTLIEIAEALGDADEAIEALLSAVGERALASDLTDHESTTTGAHGIPDPTTIVVDSDPRLTDARPTAGRRYPAGRWVGPMGVAATNTTLLAGRLYPVVIDLGKTTTIDRIGVQVTVVGGAGSTVRLGIYDVAADGNWGPLRLDAGTVDGNTVAAQEITVSHTLPPGTYWLVALAQGGSGNPQVSGVTPAVQAVGTTGWSTAPAPQMVTAASYPSGGLPASPGNLATPVATGPMIKIRCA